VNPVSAGSSAQITAFSDSPGFLQGAMTVVLKLLNLVRADHAYFGEKGLSATEDHQRDDAGVLPSYTNHPQATSSDIRAPSIKILRYASSGAQCPPDSQGV
jgi:hypothetical protein